MVISILSDLCMAIFYLFEITFYGIKWFSVILKEILHLISLLINQSDSEVDDEVNMDNERKKFYDRLLFFILFVLFIIFLIKRPRMF